MTDFIAKLLEPHEEQIKENIINIIESSLHNEQSHTISQLLQDIEYQDIKAYLNDKPYAAGLHLVSASLGIGRAILPISLESILSNEIQYLDEINANKQVNSLISILEEALRKLNEIKEANK